MASLCVEDKSSVPGEEKPPNVDEFLCVVCAEVYKKPTLLHCMHTFCAEFIDQLVVQHDGIKTVSCPNCRYVTKGGVDGTLQLWTNRLMKLKMDWYNTSTQRENNSFKCGVCGMEVASMLCTTCPSLKLCEGCSTHHKRCAKFKDHTVLDMEGLSNEDLMEPEEAICSKHGCKWKLYCNTCEVRCCAECVPDHHGHTFRLLNEVVDEKLKELDESLLQAESVSQKYDEHLGNLEQINNETMVERNRLKEEVKIAFAEMRDILVGEREKLLDWLDSTTDALKLAKEKAGHVQKMTSFLRNLKGHPKDRVFDVVNNLSSWKNDFEDMDRSLPSETSRSRERNDFDVNLCKRQITISDLFVDLKYCLSQIFDFYRNKDGNDGFMLMEPSGSITLIAKGLNRTGDKRSEPVDIGNVLWSVVHHTIPRGDEWSLECHPVRESSTTLWMCHVAFEFTLKNQNGGDDYVYSIDDDHEGRFDAKMNKITRKYSELGFSRSRDLDDQGYRKNNSMEIHVAIRMKYWQNISSSAVNSGQTSSPSTPSVPQKM